MRAVEGREERRERGKKGMREDIRERWRTMTAVNHRAQTDHDCCQQQGTDGP